MKLINSLYLGAFFVFSTQSHASLWAGTITTSAGFRLVGSADFEVNTFTDTMTLSNLTGDWATELGTSMTTTLYALDDTTTPAASIPAPTASTTDITDAMFTTSAETGLGLIANDGFFWVSTTSDSFFHLIIGGDTNSSANPLLDYDGTPPSRALSWATSPNSADDLAINLISVTATQIPEPATLALPSLALLVILGRRQRGEFTL